MAVFLYLFVKPSNMRILHVLLSISPTVRRIIIIIRRTDDIQLLLFLPLDLPYFFQIYHPQIRIQIYKQEHRLCKTQKIFT